VEDTSQEFDAVRDYADTTTLLDAFPPISFNPTPIPLTARRPKRVPTSDIIDTKALLQLRKSQKIAPRQFARMFEMHLLTRIPEENRTAGLARLTQKHRAADEQDRRYYWWRVLVKQRIYKKQRDLLMQLDPSERVEALDKAATSQQEEYEERLQGLIARFMKIEGEDGAVNGNRNGSPSVAEKSEVAAARAKRKVVIEDDDDEEKEVGGGGKRVKV